MATFTLFIDSSAGVDTSYLLPGTRITQFRGSGASGGDANGLTDYSIDYSVVNDSGVLSSGGYTQSLIGTALKSDNYNGVSGKIASATFLFSSGFGNPQIQLAHLGIVGGTYTASNGALIGSSFNLTPDGLLRVAFQRDNEANFVVVGNTGADIVHGSSLGDQLSGLDGSDILYGYNGADILNGGAGQDLIFGGNGNDTLIGGGDADVLDGGAGVDTASYESAGSGLVLSLGAPGSTGDAVGDAYSGIEIFRMSSFADTFSGGFGGDVVALGAGNDAASGNAGDDALYGEDGNDLLRGNAGNDVLHGGTGNDTVSYDDATLGVSVDLQVGLAEGFGFSNAGKDTLFDIENIRGSAFNDVLAGDAGANVIDGSAGDDYLIGRAGADILFGGAGGDVFLYRAASDSTLNVADVIRDFQLGADKIDLRPVHTLGIDAFNLMSNANGSYLSVDLGGNGSIDMLIQIATSGVTSADILWS